MNLHNKITRKMSSNLRLTIPPLGVYTPPEDLEERGNATEILPWLYLGSAKCTKSSDVMKKITHIMNVTRDYAPYNIFYYNFHRIPIDDKPCLFKITPYLDEAVKFMARCYSSGGCLLVHCLEGISRSPAFVIAFLIKEKEWSFEDAFSFVKQKRACIDPKIEFCFELKNYEIECIKQRQNIATTKSV